MIVHAARSAGAGVRRFSSGRATGGVNTQNPFATER